MRPMPSASATPHGVLPAGAAETLQRVAAHIVAAHHGNALYGIGHAAHGNLQRTRRRLLRTDRAAGGAGHALRQFSEASRDDVAVQRLVRPGAEYARKEFRLNAAQQDIRVGDGQRACAPIARGSRVGGRGLRTHTQARAIEADDRAAPRRDAVNAHHGRANPDTADFGIESALVLTRIVADIGGSAPHVEADEFAMAGGLGGAHHADDAAGRTGQNRILALEMIRLGQSARALHEIERDAGHETSHAFHIAAQNRREVGIHHGGIAARHQLHEGAHAVRHRNLSKADASRQRFGGQLVVHIAVAVHKHDGAGAQTLGEGRLQLRAERRFIQGFDEFAAGAHPFHGLDHALVQHFGKHDVPVEQPRSSLSCNAQRVAKAARDDQQRAFALAFQQRVGRDRGPHLHAGHAFRRDRLSRRQPQQQPDALDRRIRILRWILRQQLAGAKCAIGGEADDVRERAAPIDPELPARPHVRVPKRRRWHAPGRRRQRAPRRR